MPRSTHANTVQLPLSPEPRRRGRPRKDVADPSGAQALLTREQILEKATELAKVEPLSEISMVGLARELGVAPALIHYYVGSRDDLISGVANRYFRERVQRLKPPSGDWEADLYELATETYEMGVEYGGVLRYMMSHNRFRLFQQVAPGETDYGLIYLDHTAGILRDAGFSPQQSALAFHLLSLYVMSSAYAEVTRQLPAFHTPYIRNQIESHAPATTEGARFFIDPFSQLDSNTAFPEGLRLLIAGFRSWLAGAETARHSSPRRTARER